MPEIPCQYPSCTFVANNASEAIAIVMFNSHLLSHQNASQQQDGQVKQKLPPILRPTVKQDIDEEEWATFIEEWTRFKRCTVIPESNLADQLFQCCERSLGRLLIKENPTVISEGEDVLLKAMKQMAVIQIATSVRRNNLLQSKQDAGESFREFYANVKAVASTCAFQIPCNHPCCSEKSAIDYTHMVIKDILIAGVSDSDIRKELLGWSELDNKSDKEVVRFVEEKEMAFKAWSSSKGGSNVGGISGYRKNRNGDSEKAKKLSLKGNCATCHAQTSLYTEFANGKLNKNPHKYCQSCYRLNKAQNKDNGAAKPDNKPESEAGLISSFIGSVLFETSGIQNVYLDHHIFTEDGWRKALSFEHPKLILKLSTDIGAYINFKVKPPPQIKRDQNVVADSGAQSCLWSREIYLNHGYRMKDLIPVKHNMKAANSAPISIDGAIILKLEGYGPNNEKISASVMTYVSPDAKAFYLSKEALIQLQVIPKDFPKVGSALIKTAVAGIVHPQETEEQIAKCGCLKRVAPPPKPKDLPFQCTKENVPKMKQWLVDRYKSSTFNKCPHQVLPEMAGPPIQIHIDPNAKPVCLRTPAPVPLHWQEQVKKELFRDVELGVLEPVPHGEPTKWCFRMVISRKHDGGPRRTVDLSPLNKFCEREVHPSKSPFTLARSVPTHSIKTVCDVWNGYHSVPLREEDRHLTTFITPWGHFRYKRAPQGFVSSGDGFNRRFDDVAAHIQRMERCVDDSLLHDPEIELSKHWWRIIDFLDLVAESGMICNVEKFQFSEPTVDFAGFRISRDTIEPLPKYLDAIRHFPVPRCTTDIRSWFGLVNQVSHYAQLRDCLTPFRKFLSPRVKFEWDEPLTDAFEESKHLIVEAIKEGVKIYDITKKTCLTTDFSKSGIGYLLTQKHCSCNGKRRGCCIDGWPITLAGSRFLDNAESNYAPVEGEALAVAWSLEQTKFFTMGCNDLLVNTDHKPLVKILGDSRLDQIDNPRLLRLKKRTLLWKFDIEYKPGKQIKFADATSRHPISSYAELASLALQSTEDVEESLYVASLKQQTNDFKAVTWDRVREASLQDKETLSVKEMVENGFPPSKADLPDHLKKYWDFKDNFNVHEDVILYMDRIVIPQSLRQEILDCLHSAHQGVSSMLARAQASIFWPGVSQDIESKRQHCSVCHRNAPSQAKLPPLLPRTPTVPFELIFADYFKLIGKFFLIIGDRLSGWTEIVNVKHGSDNSGAKGLCEALRTVFQTFGVPDEITSDGGPEFVAAESVAFYKKWGVSHRLSSSYFPQGNGRAEVAVKATKRLLEENMGSDGNLRTDSLVRALLQMRNTPDRDCRLSPAEVLFGRPLRDAMPKLDKSKMLFENPQVHRQWHDAWAAKEEALRSRLVRSTERLEEHTRDLDPLKQGDNVFIQNQDPSSKEYKKWNRQGTIIIAGKYDQYLVRVHGTGRLTVRNRRFLRKYMLRSPTVGGESELPKISSKDLVGQKAIDGALPKDNGVVARGPSESRGLSLNEQQNQSSLPNAETTTPLMHPATSHQELPVQTVQETQSTAVPEVPKEQLATSTPPLRRSTRERVPRKIYDASTGSYISSS